ncbi:AraC family transcriptional regulator [Paenibacillus cymbidii]|uniref:AraC family transcriptional regulator n=1 Tax=Paenibacillus cymbidii TaxID=1639034 RepID=UPI001F403204|nr:AraC family transcriptional regulator [Paenibacillus cymbidii]
MRWPKVKAMPYKRKLMLFSIVISITPVIIVGFVSSRIAARSIQDQVNLNHRLLLRQIEYKLNQMIENLNIHSISIATSSLVERSVENGPPERTDVNESMELVESLRKQVNYFPNRYEVSIIYKKYDYVYSTAHASTSLADSLFQPILQRTRTDRNSPFLVTPNEMNNQELMFFRPVPIKSFYTNGIVVLRVPVDELIAMIDESMIGADFGSRIVIVDGEGKVFASGSGEEIGAKLTASTDLYRFWQNPGSSNSSRLGGVEYKLSGLKFANRDWTIIAMTPESVLYGKSDRIGQITWTIVALLAAFWTIVALGGSRFLYAPVDRMLRVLLPEYKARKDRRDGLIVLEMLLHDMRREYELLRTKAREWEAPPEEGEPQASDGGPGCVEEGAAARSAKLELAIRHILQCVHGEYDADLQAISRQYDISVPRLSRLFKEKTGEHFSDYLIRERMIKAQEWLAHSNLLIKDIAAQLHYSTVQSFNRTFKQYTGIPPGEYRRLLPDELARGRERNEAQSDAE